jgi:hypothetical protein
MNAGKAAAYFFFAPIEIKPPRCRVVDVGEFSLIECLVDGVRHFRPDDLATDRHRNDCMDSGL